MHNLKKNNVNLTENCQFIWTMFLTSRSICVLNIILIVWTRISLYLFHHNFLNFNDSKSSTKQIIKIKYEYHVDVIFVPSAKTELWKAYFFRLI